MKSRVLFVFVIATLLSFMGVAQARRHYNSGALESAPRAAIESQDNTTNLVVGTSRGPLVQASDTALMCLFKDANNSFCWKFQSPMLTIGWQWK